jgi:hypothetical protein
LSTVELETQPRVGVAPSGSFVVVWTGQLSVLHDVIFGQRYSASGARLGSEFRVSSNAADIHQYRPAVALDGAGDFVVVWDGFSLDGSENGVFGRRFASGGEPLAADFLVNTQTSGKQQQPVVSSDSSGNFVVVWEGATDGSGYGIFAQRYASSGAPIGSELRLNGYTTHSQRRPAVAADSSGVFVVTWDGYQEGGNAFDEWGVFGRPFVASGAALERDFHLNTSTTNSQFHSAVAALGSGNFVAVWSSAQSGTSYEIFGQRFTIPVPRGTEFRINTYTTSFQFAPSMAMSSQGDFVVIWESYRDGGGILDEFGVFGQRYSRTGVPLGTEFRVNTHTTGNQEQASAAMDSAGAFVVVWTSYGGEDGSGAGVFGRRYAGAGSPLGDQFRVNTYTTGAQVRGAVASDSAGNTVVVWESFGRDGNSYGIYGQRFSATAALGAEFPINTYTSNAQRFPSVASSADGSFVVVWQSDGADGSAEGISGQRFASNGDALAGEFRVNTTTTGKQYVPKVAADAGGNFVVVWAATNVTGFSIAAQRYASSGERLGDEFIVSPLATLDRRVPAVAMNPAGDFVVTWNSPSDGSGKGVSLQQYRADGQPVGADFEVNTFTTGDQMQSAVALGPSLVVVWQGDGEDGDFTGIFGQRYQACASGDVNADGNVDVADVFYLINALFASGPAPVCSGDVNGDTQLDVGDVFYLINYLFASGPPPV